MKEQTVSIKQQNIRKSFMRKFHNNWEFFMMVLPGALAMLVFCYLPMVGILVAFKDINYIDGILKSPWCGFKNFEFLFKSPDTWLILRNTIGYNIAFIAISTTLPIALAIGMSRLRNKRLSKLYQTTMMLPHFISWVVVSYVVTAFLDYRLGLVNTSVMQMLGKEPMDWYSKPEYWPYIIILLNTWKGFGYNSVVYVAAVAGIDRTLYEAAAIDGASKRQQTWYITIPELSNMAIIMMILNIGKIMSSDFGLFYNVPMEKGALFPATNVISTFVFRALKINGDIGMSSAAGFLQSVVGLIMICLTNMIVKRIDEDKALF